MSERINYSDMADNEPSDIQKLLAWLIKKGDNLPYSLCQSQVTPKHLRRKAEFETVINALVETNHIKIKDQDGKRFININPKLLS